MAELNPSDLEALADAIRRGTTAEDAKAEALRVGKAKFDALAGSVGKTADAFITYNKELYKGSSNAKAAATSMDKLGEAAEYAGAGLALLIPGGVLVKGLAAGLGLLTSKLLTLGKAAIEQTDEIYKGTQSFAQLGAAGAGMQDTFDSLNKKVGLGTEKFEAYFKLIEQNTNMLALYGGTVNQGKKIFEDTMQSFSKEQRVEMELMGLNREKQAESTMRYIQQQRLLTMGTKAQMDTSSAAVMKYIEETDRLTRITGANADQQQKILEQAMSQDVFASFIDDLEAKGTKGAAAADRARMAIILASENIGKETAQGLQDMVSGFFTSKEAEKFAMSYGAGGQRLIKTLRDTNATEQDVMAAFNELNRSSAQVNKTFKSATSLGVAGDTLVKYAERRRAEGMSAQDLVKNYGEAQKELARQKADPLTKKMADAENTAREAALLNQRNINQAMGQAVEDLGDLADAALAAARNIERMTGRQPGKEPKSLEKAQQDLKAAEDKAVKAQQEADRLKADKSASDRDKKRAQQAADEAAAESQQAARDRRESYYKERRERQKARQAEGGARATGQPPPEPTPPAAPGAPGAPGTSNAVEPKAGTTPDKPKGEVVGKTAGVNSQLLAALGQVAAEFGSPIRVNSGLRTPEEQKKMYDEWVAAGGGPGNPTVNTPSFGKVTTPARSGTSFHQQGFAVDLDKEIADKLDSMGYLKTAGLVRPNPNGDPVHIQLAQMEAGGDLAAGKLAIAGEKGKPEIIQGPATVSSNYDLMAAFDRMTDLQERSIMILENISRATNNGADATTQMLRYAQN